MPQLVFTPSHEGEKMTPGGKASSFQGSLGRSVSLSGIAFAAIGCASTASTYDLRPAYQAAVPAAQVSYLACDEVSDVVCDCRRGGLEQELSNPSRAHFDKGYAVLTTELAKGSTQTDAESKAVHSIFAAVKKDVEDICSYHEKEATS